MVMSNALAGGKVAVLDYIRLRCTAAGASTTSSEVSFEVDAADRYSSGVATTLTSYKCNPGGDASNVTCRLGGITASAAGASRQFIGSCLIRVAASPCWIVNDTVMFVFGTEGTTNAVNIAAPLATTAIQTVFPFSPAVVPAGGSFVAHIANIANAATAPSFEWEIGWIER